jgi:uncharacterized membrane protein (GlpM family)
MLLALKLTIVPLFISLITLAGRKWGQGVAGLMGAFPVVAGPIIIFIAHEQGPVFAASSAISAISASSCLLIFGLAYSWACLRFNWFTALILSLLAWLMLAITLAITSPGLEAALAISFGSLIATPLLLPRIKATASPLPKLHDLPWRMLVGALLTFTVTTLATSLGETWSGILAVFPVIGSVLAVFTHTALGPAQVVQIYQGMARGLYSFVAFFLGLATLLPITSIWMSCLISIAMAATIQLVIQLIIRIKKS